MPKQLLLKICDQQHPHSRPTIAIMQAVLAEILCINVGGLKTTVRISKPEDFMHVNDITLVRICSKSSWVHLICEDNPKAPQPVPKNFSLTKSIGFKSLMKLRNSAQAADFASEEKSSSCNLFGNAPASKKAKKLSRARINAMRQAHSLVSIQLDHYGSVQMLRPVHTNDALFVEYSPEAITAVINYMREKGFEDTDQGSVKDSSLPKGIWKRADHFVVQFKKADDTFGYKRCATLEDCIIFQAEQAEQADLAAECANDPEGGIDAAQAGMGDDSASVGYEQHGAAELGARAVVDC